MSTTPTPHAAPEPGPDEEPGPGESVGRGFAALPNLRPYCDPRLLADYKPHVIEAGRRGGPQLLRALRLLARGVRVLSGLLADWLSGRIGRRGSALARLGIALGAVYAVIRMSMLHPAALWVVAGGLLLAATLAGLDRLPIPNTKPAAQAAKKPTKSKASGALAACFTARRKANSEAPDSTPEAPAEDPLIALIRELIGDDAGVHLAVLRPAMRDRLPGLAGASDSRLNEVLRDAGFDPAQKARAGGVGGRAGVRRSQLPPLSPRDAQGPLSAAAESPRPANSPADSSRAESGGERSDRGLRYVRDPERGPQAWRIEHDE